MLSQQKSVLVLMGAGASYGLVPQVQDITDTLLTWVAPGTNIPSPFFEPFMQKAGRKKTLLNFEDLIDFLDTLASWNWTANNGFDFYPTLWLMNKVFRRRSFRRGTMPHLQLNGGLLRLDAFKARVEVLSHIYRASDSLTMPKAPINTILSALNQEFRLTVASLNYDNVLDFGNLPLDNGFHLPLPKDTKQFDPRFEFSTSEDVAFLPLHGSVHFVPPFSLGQSVIASPLQPLWVQDIHRAEALRQSSSVGYSAIKDWQIDPVMITGRNKLANTVTYPYSAYMSLLRRHAFADDTWFIVGYGGNDAHINAVLGQALYTRVGVHHPPKIIVCDYGSAATLDSLFRRMWTFSGFSASLGDEENGWLPLFTLHKDCHLGWAWLNGVESLSQSVVDLLSHMRP